LKRYWRFLIYFFLYNPFLFAETIDCEKITSFLFEKETQIELLNLNDPDYIPLHYLLAQDIIIELNQFRKEVIPFFTECPTITFSELINKYDELRNSVQLKHDSLAHLSKKVYLIFYERAIYEYQLNNEADAAYYLDRSLQYNDTFPEAILLKLNKLLDANHFEACLLLLNTLYYETDLDREQEKQAILFTDKFYNTLYKTADSLVRNDHAAEALERFEILEIFCQNLPTAYCNDDYYHGVLRSKTGIYESYLAIAKVAEKRNNPQIAEHFYQYAKEYLEANPHLGVGGGEVREVREVKEVKEVGSVMGDVRKNENIELQWSSKEMQEKYDKLVLQALALAIKENFLESYRLFLEAKKLENCNCIKTDFRVELMLKELLKVMR